MSYLPKHNPGAAFTVPATSALAAGRLVNAAGATAAADAVDVIGVAARTVPTGEHVTVYSGGVQRLVAAGAITVSAPLKAAEGGTVTVHTPGTDPAEAFIGIALAAGETDDVIDVKFLR